MLHVNKYLLIVVRIGSVIYLKKLSEEIFLEKWQEITGTNFKLFKIAYNIILLISPFVNT